MEMIIDMKKTGLVDLTKQELIDFDGGIDKTRIKLGCIILGIGLGMFVSCTATVI